MLDQLFGEVSVLYQMDNYADRLGKGPGNYIVQFIIMLEIPQVLILKSVPEADAYCSSYSLSVHRSKTRTKVSF